MPDRTLHTPSDKAKPIPAGARGEARSRASGSPSLRPGPDQGGQALAVPELLTVGTLAARWSLSSRQIYRLITEQGLPVVRLGKRAVRFRPSDVEKWLSGRSS
jgi:excisionase family DNA binding protein